MCAENRVLRVVIMPEIEIDLERPEREVREILLRRKKGYCALNIIIIYIIGIIHRRFLRTYAEYNESTIK